MPGIVCAIRGGPASHPTIYKAIAVAEETRQTIYFLYVVNLDFLTLTSTSRVHVVEKELRQMGEFILLAAQTQAAKNGVTAEPVVRKGQVRAEIIGLCHEVDAEYVILGQPRGQNEVDTFTHDRMEQFRQEIEQESGAKVVLAEETQE
ncbi:MAG: universal stress protein [Anaerolineae bacterium]|nr:universal stress protein [Anaerolineae bacterium]